MKNFKNTERGKHGWLKDKLVSISILTGITIVLVLGTFYISNMGNKQGLQLTREAVNRAAIECYAVEGNYPPTVEYMEKNYGLTYDRTKYYIFYEVFASNIMPTIEVYEKR